MQQPQARPSLAALPRALRAAWPPLAYLLLSILMTWPLAASLGARLPGLGDALLQTWILAWIAHILRVEPLALWQAPIFYPYPDTTAYHDPYLVQSIIGAPVIWATGNPVLAHNLLLLISFALTGWAVYLLACDVAAEAAPDGPPAAIAWAAFAAGCAVAFSSYRIAHLVHVNLLQMAWLVFALRHLRRLLRPWAAGGGRWQDAALLGLFTGVQIGSAIYYGFFAVVLMSGYGLLWAAGALWRRVRRGEPLPWALLPRLGLAAALAVALIAPLLMPYLRIYTTLGIVRSTAELDNWSAPLRAYLSVPASNRLYAPLGEVVVDSGEMVLFPGLLLAGLGLLAVGMGINGGRRAFSGTPRGDITFWALLAAGALLLSLGTAVRLVRYGEPLPIPTPYLLLYNSVPGFGSMRVPSRWGWLVTLGLALLAAVALARLLARARPLWRSLGGAAAAAIILAEQAAFPIPLSQPVLADIPPVYAWLGAPAQSDLTTVVELPTGPLPRGEELERITWRHFYSLAHWKRLPVAYSGVIPFGTAELMRRLQDLPEPGVIDYLRLTGVDTLVLHRDEYEPEALAALTAGLDALPQLRRRADVGESTIYAIAPDPALDLPPGSLFISADERMPGLPVLGLLRRWEREGRELYGPGRLRFYAPLREPRPGQVLDFGLLGRDEEPAAHGYDAGGLLWEGQGLALYRRDEDLLASLALGAPPRGQFHPRYPDTLTLTPSAHGLWVGETELTWAQPESAVAVELDVASVRGGDIEVGGQPLGLPPGLSTVRLLLERDTTTQLEGHPGSVAIMRMRAVRPAQAETAVVARPGLAAAAEASFDGTLLTVRAWGAGARGVLLDIRGARASDDRPVYLLSGALPLSPDAAASFTIDPLRPEAPWLAGSEAAEDGRYIVYLKSGDAPEGPGQAVAQFQIRAGRVAEFAAVPLPLTAVP